MNIIQQQDRLKSLPEEVLIEYIANPTGEVPTFLALGEIERRKVMRNKYAAQQAEQPPVSEQIVQESRAARMPQAMPQPPMAPSGDAGITALPAPNVGQNYAQGGVVLNNPQYQNVLTPAQRRQVIRNLNNYYASPKPQRRVFDEVLGEYVLTDDYKASTEPTGRTKSNIFGNAGPFASTAYDNYVSGLKGLTDRPISLLGAERFSGKEVTFDPNIPPAYYDPETGNVIGLDYDTSEDNRGIAGVSVGEEKFTPDQKADQKRFNEKRQKDQEEVAAREKIIRDEKLKAAEKEEKKQGKKDSGEKVDTYYADLRADIEGDRDLARDKDDALNMALITAGLSIAGGTSQNALENIAAGALPGVQSYTQSLKDIKDEERGIRKELRGVGALERAEQLEYAKIAAERGLSIKEYSDTMNDIETQVRAKMEQIVGGRQDPLFDEYVEKRFGTADVTAMQKEEAINDYRRVLREQLFGSYLPTIPMPPSLRSASGDTTGFSARLIN